MRTSSAIRSKRWPQHFVVLDGCVMAHLSAIAFARSPGLASGLLYRSTVARTRRVSSGADDETTTGLCVASQHRISKIGCFDRRCARRRTREEVDRRGDDVDGRRDGELRHRGAPCAQPGHLAIGGEVICTHPCSFTVRKYFGNIQGGVQKLMTSSPVAEWAPVAARPSTGR